MLSIYNHCQDLAERATISILKKGKIPKHIGIILDGNRRYAREHGQPTSFGHAKGCDQLSKVLDVCMRLGVEAVTVFAFSIENFKRSKDEVEYIMNLFGDAFSKFNDENELIDNYNIRVQFLGNLSFLPPDIEAMAKNVMERTKGNRRHILNICCPYTSRDEISTAIQHNVRMVKEGKMLQDDITAQTIQDALFTSNSPPLDILIRTSGEIRLSDFLLWQASDRCQIQFVHCYWPEFTLWHLLPIIVEYQIYGDHA